MYPFLSPCATSKLAIMKALGSNQYSLEFEYWGMALDLGQYLVRGAFLKVSSTSHHLSQSPTSPHDYTAARNMNSSNTCDIRLIESLDRLAACIEDLRQRTTESNPKECAITSTSRSPAIITNESAQADPEVVAFLPRNVQTEELFETVEDIPSLEEHYQIPSQSTREGYQQSTPSEDDDSDNLQVGWTLEDFYRVPDEQLDSFWQLGFTKVRNEALKKCFDEFPWSSGRLRDYIPRDIVIGSSDLQRDWFSFTFRDPYTLRPVSRSKYGPPYCPPDLVLKCDAETLERIFKEECILFPDRRDVIWRKLIREKIEETWPWPDVISTTGNGKASHNLPLRVKSTSGREIYGLNSSLNLVMSIIRL